MQRIVFIVATSVLFLLGCQGESTDAIGGPSGGTGPGPGRTGDVIDDQLVAANNQFGLQLYTELLKAETKENIFVSPSSIAIALAMTYNGADGETETAMAKALSLEDMTLDEVNEGYAQLESLLENPDSSVQLSIANSLWVGQGLPFKPEFLQRNRDFYAAEITALDFRSSSAAPTINKWVSDNTNGKIPSIVKPPISPETIMFLINAIYFKGTWTYEFDEKLTTDRPFHLSDGGTIQHPLMVQSRDYQYLKGSDFQAVKLPYGTERLGMYVFLPDEGSTLEAFHGALRLHTWNQWMTQFEVREGRVALPRFRVEYEKSLNDVLKAMGMAIAFDGRTADFSRMFPVSAAANVFISNVKHKTFVEVNEEGTEAAAATSVEIGVTAFEPDSQPFRIIVDRPFFFAIRDDLTGAILFMGSIGDPRGK